jgi:hypothetical protein
MTTPYMVLDLPTVSVTIGPLWATKINAAITQIDSHDHSAGKGVQVTPSGLNINADVSFKPAATASSITGLKTAAFDPQGAPLASSFTHRLYDVSGDAYWNDASGTAIRITAAGALNAAALTPVAVTAVDVVGDVAILPGDTFGVMMINTAAPRLITLPLANSVTKGRFYLLIDATGQAATNAITLAPNGFGTDTIDGTAASETLQTNHGRWRVWSDGSTKWFVERSSQEVFRIGITRPATIAIGNGLYGTSTRGAAWSALNLAGGANYVSGILPAANLPDATTGPAKGILQLSGDLGGTSITPLVISLTGAAGTVSVLANAFTWADGFTPAIQQVAKATAGAGALFSWVAQNANTAGNGGGITIQTGNPAGAGLKGTLTGKIGSATIGFEAKEIAANQRVFCPIPISAVTATELPAGTGDGVMFLRDAAVSPTVVPVGGVVFSSNGGKLRMLSTADSFETDFSRAASATAGAAGLPVAAASWWVVKVGTTNYKIPLFNT